MILYHPPRGMKEKKKKLTNTWVLLCIKYLSFSYSIYLAKNSKVLFYTYIKTLSKFWRWK